MLVPYHQLLVPQSNASHPSDDLIRGSDRFENYGFFKLNDTIVLACALLLAAAFLLG